MNPCPHCQEQNRDEARFCGHCGQSLSGESLRSEISEPSRAGRKPLFGIRAYALLAALGWLTLLTPFVTIQGCNIQENIWGIEWIEMQYGEGKTPFLQKKIPASAKGPPRDTLETALAELESQWGAEMEKELEDTVAETYRDAPFYLRPILSIDPVPEVSYVLFLLVMGLAWLQWYRPVDGLCLAGGVVCLYTILNIYVHQHVLAQQVLPFGTVQIQPGWGIFVLTGLWGVLLALNRFQREAWTSGVTEAQKGAEGRIESRLSNRAKVLAGFVSGILIGAFLSAFFLTEDRGDVVNSPLAPSAEDKPVPRALQSSDEERSALPIPTRGAKPVKPNPENSASDVKKATEPTEEANTKPLETVVKLGKEIKLWLGEGLERMITFDLVKVTSSYVRDGRSWKPKPNYKFAVIQVNSKNIGMKRDLISSQSFKLEVDKGYIYELSSSGIKVGLLPEETSQDDLVFEILESTTPMQLHVYLAGGDTRAIYEFTENLNPLPISDEPKPAKPAPKHSVSVHVAPDTVPKGSGDARFALGKWTRWEGLAISVEKYEVTQQCRGRAGGLSKKGPAERAKLVYIWISVRNESSEVIDFPSFSIHLSDVEKDSDRFIGICSYDAHGKRTTTLVKRRS